MEANLLNKTYKIIDDIGEGGFGKTFKVFNIENNEIYVIKKIPLKDKDLEQIQKEAEILSSIHNENIVKYFESFTDNEYFYIVMEYCQGLDLKKYINKYKKEKGNKRMDPNIIYKYIIDICKGLKEIHSNNIIHRDIKPDNLLITENNKIKICDFGISKQLGPNNNYANTTIGTLYYCAPEIFDKKPYNNKIDIWSLGCVIYELCTKKLCFEGESHWELLNKIMACNYTPLNEELNNYYQLNDLIKLLLNKDYKKRPNADAVIDYLQKKFNIQNEDINYLGKEWKEYYSIQNTLNSICLIKNKKRNGFGFLIKLEKNKKMYYYLLGCDIIKKEDIKPDNNIIICYDKEKKAIEIELNKNERYFQDYNYLNININAFIIEILPKDNIN